MSYIPTPHCVKSKSSSGPGVRRKAAAQPLIWASIGRDPACRFPFPPIDKARCHVSYDPGNRVTLISTPSPACLGRRRHNFHISITPSNLPASRPLPSDPHKSLPNKQDMTRHSFRGYCRKKFPLMSDYLSVFLPPPFPPRDPRHTCRGTDTRRWNTILPALLITCDTNMRDTPGF